MPRRGGPWWLWHFSPAARTWTGPSGPAGALAFHRSLPGYAPTQGVRFGTDMLGTAVTAGRIGTVAAVLTRLARDICRNGPADRP